MQFILNIFPFHLFIDIPSHGTLSTPGLTVNLKCSKGFHSSLFVGGGADVYPRILMADTRNRQRVELLETLRRKLFFQLDTETDTISIINNISVNKKSILLYGVYRHYRVFK